MTNSKDEKIKYSLLSFDENELLYMMQIQSQNNSSIKEIFSNYFIVDKDMQK
jgi:hypothetical protein